MSKRFIISEEEKKDILKKYNLLSEQNVNWDDPELEKCVKGAGGVKNSDNSYTIKDSNGKEWYYYGNSRYSNPNTLTMGTYYCQGNKISTTPPTQNKGTGGSTNTGGGSSYYGSNYVKEAQKLIGMSDAEQDGKFGPKTLEVLKAKLGQTTSTTKTTPTQPTTQTNTTSTQPTTQTNTTSTQPTTQTTVRQTPPVSDELQGNPNKR